MKTLKITREVRAYTEDEAKQYIENFRQGAVSGNYVVGAAGYTLKQKKKKGEVVAEAWICKCVEIHNEIWEEDEG